MRIMIAAGLLALPLPALSQTLPGITYAVDTASESKASDVFNSLLLRVTYAGGLGRIDVLARASRSPVRVKWVTIPANSAAPGDYYLFDSTRLIHVRPASRTYSAYPLAAVSHNYEDRRDGWPFFRFDPDTPRVIAADSPVAKDAPSAFTVFWHFELMRDMTCATGTDRTCFVRPLSRGRVDVRAPAEEGGVARWVGPTRALAAIADFDQLVDAPVNLTAVVHWTATRGDSVAFLAVGRRFTGLRRVEVDPARLELPRGFTETPRPAAGTPR